jgi:hypothetical protein
MFQVFAATDEILAVGVTHSLISRAHSETTCTFSASAQRTPADSGMGFKSFVVG